MTDYRITVESPCGYSRTITLPPDSVEEFWRKRAWENGWGIDDCYSPSDGANLLMEDLCANLDYERVRHSEHD